MHGMLIPIHLDLSAGKLKSM